jgi:hypothetical protein
VWVVCCRCLERTHNPLVPGSSPGGPTISRQSSRYSTGEFTKPQIPPGWIPALAQAQGRLFAGTTAASKGIPFQMTPNPWVAGQLDVEAAEPVPI